MEHATKLGSWGELYVMLGTSAAALIGLLFVATSLHLTDMGRDPIFLTRSRNVTLHLVALLVQAIAVLTPQPGLFLGAEIILINLCGLYLPIGFAWRIFVGGVDRRGGFSIYRWVTYVSGYVLGVAGGAALCGSFVWGLYLVTAANVIFLVSVILDAWKLMVGARDARKATKRIRTV